MYRAVLDPTVVLGYAAAVTTRVRLGVAVLNMPFVSPVLVAKQGATARRPLRRPARPRPRHGLVGGGVRRPPARRSGTRRAGRRTSSPPSVHCGRRTRSSTRASSTPIPQTMADPQPVQRPHPPILLGGTAPAALRRAGRLTDGWVSSSRADLSPHRRVHRHRQGGGRRGRARPGGAAVRLPRRGAGTGAERGPQPAAGQPGADPGRPRRLAGTGLTEIFVDLNFDPEVGSPDADPAASMERAEAVLTALAPYRVSRGTLYRARR